MYDFKYVIEMSTYIEWNDYIADERKDETKVHRESWTFDPVDKSLTPTLKLCSLFCFMAELNTRIT